MATPRAARELTDVEMRLKHMNELGIEFQVVHNSFWIEQITQRKEVEAALCRSWNQWLADLWKQGQGRLRWSCVIPTLAMDEIAQHMKFAKEHGAVAVCLRPLEGERFITDPYFYPVFEEASRLGLAIAVHIANGNPANCQLLRYFPGTRIQNGLALFRVPTVLACYALLMSDLPQRFPLLRWGFIEASAMWLPWIYQEAARRLEADGKPMPKDVFRNSNIFVSCQTNDDVPWILRYAGDHCLMIGTDYGHTDPASEVNAISVLKESQRISAETKERILWHNPKALYGL